MQWTDLPSSELAAQLKARKLEHPTSAAFNEDGWRLALAALPAPAERDVDLAFAAIYFGRELRSLRQVGIPLTTEGMNRPRLVQLLAAFANQQYLTLQAKVLKELKAKKNGDVFDMERMQQIMIEGSGGQEMAPDDHVANLVDSLPHWLFHIWNVADDAPSNEPKSVNDFGARACQIVSVEHSLRHLWLTALWIGTTFSEDGDALVDAPRNRALAERRFIFDQRQQLLIGLERNLEAGANIMAGGKLPPVAPAMARTVIRMERQPSGNRKFIIGRALGTKSEQRGHVGERDMLERLYTGLFLDEALPHSPGGTLTCRELSAAWWVLKDLARIAADKLGVAWMADDKAVERFALTVERADLVQIIADCLEIDAGRAADMVDWLTCDPADTSRIFSKSFWSEPLLPKPGSNRRHILLAPLLVGSPVKRVEAWMERGGISDNSGIKGRGKPFERDVRVKLADAVTRNKILTDALVAEHGLKRKNNSEEIDLLVRIGDAVIVGEVKCFIAPSEPIEHHNLLANLSKATAQAKTKGAWAEQNRDLIAAALGIDDAARAAVLKIHPVVVLNHGFGIGLERDGVPIVDLHYIKLLLGSSGYQGDTRFERGVGMTYRPVILYNSQADFAANLDDLLRSPPPLKRYEEMVAWRRLPFVTSTGRAFLIELPTLAEPSTTDLLRDIRPARPGERRGC